MKKGKKCWTIRMDNKGLYDAVAVTYERTASDDLAYYRMPTTHDGEPDSIVVDVKPADVFGTEREAVAECIRRCLGAAERWTKRASELTVRLEKNGAGAFQ